MGKPAVKGARTRGDCDARPERALDREEPAKKMIASMREHWRGWQESIRARAGLVRARTALVNAARGLVKSHGERLRKCGTQQVSREIGSGLGTARNCAKPCSRCCAKWNR